MKRPQKQALVKERIVQLMLISSIYHATKAMGITTDSNSINGQLCPEVVVWTCSLTTTDSTIRFYINRGNVSIPIDGQNHPARFELQYTKSQFISKGEYTLSEPVAAPSEKITRTLTVNNDELYDLGYSHIGCGTVKMNMTVSCPLDLDREVPTRPEVMTVDLLVNKTSSQIYVQIETNSMVYNSSRCNYKQNSYFITRVFSEYQVHTWQTNFNSSSCTGSDCVITGSFPQPVAPGNVTIEVEAVSQYNRSTPYKISIPDLQFTLEINNCHFMVLCSTTGSVGGSSCNIQFQSMTEPVTITVGTPVNQYYELDELKYGTTYTVQATLKIANVTYTHEESFTTKKRGTQCKQVQLITVVLISVGMASLSMCVCGVFIVVAIFKTAKYGNRKVIAKVKREYPESAQSSVVVPFEEVLAEQKENDLMPPTPGNMAATKSPQLKFQFDPYGDGRSYNTLEKNCVELEQEKTFEKHDNASMDRAGDIYDTMEQSQAAHSEG